MSAARYTTGSGLNRDYVDGPIHTRRSFVARHFPDKRRLIPMERPEGEPPLWLGVLIMFAGVGAVVLTVLLFSEMLK